MTRQAVSGIVVLALVLASPLWLMPTSRVAAQTSTCSASGTRTATRTTKNITLISTSPPQTIDNVRYEGLQPTGYPPDPYIAVGPDTVIVVVNREFVIYDKNNPQATNPKSNQLYANTFASWFGITNGNLTDPRVIYDNFNNRFIMVISWIDDSVSPKKGWWLVSVSSTPTGNGDWYNYHFDAQYRGSSTIVPPDLIDIPYIGVDGEALYLTGNAFVEQVGDAGFRAARIRIITLADLYAPNPAPAVGWRDCVDLRNADGSKADRVAPALQYGPNRGPAYFVNAAGGGGNFLTVWAITNPLSASPTIIRKNILVDHYDPPPDAEQRGTTQRLETNFSNILQAQYWNGSIWTVQGVNLSGRAGILWHELNPAGPDPNNQATVLQAAYYGNPPRYDYYYPAFAVDDRGNFRMVFNISSANDYVSIRTAGRSRSDPQDTLSNSTLVRVGTATYTPRAGTVRWGDYGGRALDPDGEHTWLFHIAARSGTAAGIGTWIQTERYYAIYLPLVRR